MSLRQWKNVVSRAAQDINNNHALSFAAALAYYCVISLFPALITLAALVSLLPIPNLFQNLITVIGRVVPGESMGLLNHVVADVIRPHSSGLLSFGVLGSLWTVSSGFCELIEALDVAYDVPETRSLIKTRLLAVWLAILVGGMLIISVICMTAGPHLLWMFADKLGIGGEFIFIWKYARWAIAGVLVVLSIEAIYFLAPNVKQCFWNTLPGALIAIVSWGLLSAGLGFYFTKYAHLNKTYGTLGGGIALLVWLYWTGFVVIVGGELNSEIIQERDGGTLPLKQPPPERVKPVPADSTQLAA
ncbi:MAG TPA: YihY/virulence factor BrkB family protein [Candidatus Koribacter sp.]|jgi:membrane protein